MSVLTLRRVVLQMALAIFLVAFAFADKPVPRAKGTGSMDKVKEILSANTGDIPCDEMRTQCRDSCVSEILTDDEVIACQNACDAELRACARANTGQKKVERIKALRKTHKMAKIASRQARIDKQKLAASDLRVSKQVYEANNVKKVRR